MTAPCPTCGLWLRVIDGALIRHNAKNSPWGDSCAGSGRKVDAQPDGPVARAGERQTEVAAA